MTRTMLMTVLGTLALLGSPTSLTADDKSAYQQLVAAYKARRYEDVVRLCDAFLKAHPTYKYVGTAMYLGGRSALEAERFDRAEVLLRRFAKEHPTHRYAELSRSLLVNTLFSARKLAECITHCEASLKALPQSKYRDHWQYFAGASQFRAWRFADAKRSLDALNKEHPGSRYARKADSYLERINPKFEANAHGLVKGYSGTFAEDVRLKQAVAQIPAHWKAAKAELKRTLGVDVGTPDGRTLIVLADKAASRDTLRAQGETLCIDDKIATQITFYTEFIVVSLPGFRSRFIHELKHAIFRHRMGQRNLSLPKWVKEGLAVYGAGQLPDRMAAILGGQQFSGRDPHTVANGLESMPHGVDDYPEDALAFVWLESRKAGSVALFCKQLLSGTAYRDAFAAVAGMPYPKAVAAANAHARAAIKTALGPGWRQLLALRIREGSLTVSARKAWYQDTGIQAYKSWMIKHRGHLLEPNVRYRIGQAQILVGQFDAGRIWLRKVLKLDQLRSTICDDAAYWIARSFELQGKQDEAARAFAILLRDYSWSRKAQQAREKYEAAGPVKK